MTSNFKDVSLKLAEAAAAVGMLLELDVSLREQVTDAIADCCDVCDSCPSQA